MENGTIVRAKALGHTERLTPEQEFDLEPFSGPENLEGVYESWEAAGRIIHTVGGFEADPDTIEQIVAPALSISERARLTLKNKIANKVQ